MKISVVCYSGYKADERPLRFRLGTRDYRVEEVMDQWYGPDDLFFKVRAGDGNVYILRRHGEEAEGDWTLESFREIKGRSD